MFDRLLGLETEYAIRFVPSHGRTRPTNSEISDALASNVNAVSQSLFRLSRRMRDCLATAGYGR